MKPAILIDMFSDSARWLARFDVAEDGGGLCLFAEPDHRLKACVQVYDLDDLPDVRRDEISLWWEGERRCWVAVRGRIRHLDVQEGHGVPGTPPSDAPHVEAVSEEREDDEEEDEVVTMRLDLWHDRQREDMIARFEQDGVRGAVYLVRPKPLTILGLVHVYDLSEWPDVRPEEVKVWWEGDRCWAAVRGRRRYIDVQTDAQDAGEVRKAS